jgi:murein DD-endopeptidase MepM/ murein hydrolase activator NlpD
MSEYIEPFSASTRGDEFGNMAAYRKNPHRGQDWAPGQGRVIPAITAGKVIANFWSDGLGHCLIQSTTDKVFVLYAHLLAEPNLAVGHALKIGDSIGQVGNTGTLTLGAHLHLSIAKAKNVHEVAMSKLIDPLKHIAANKGKK